MAISSLLLQRTGPYPDPLTDASRIKNTFSTIILPFFTGLAKSRLLRAGAVALLGSLLHPLVPVALGVLVTVASVAVIICCLTLPFFKGLRQVEFELMAPIRLFRPRNYHEIVWEGAGPGKIYLGALPNQLNGFGKHLVSEKGIASVFSLNEPWERNPQLLFVPYTPADWQELGVAYREIDVIDHTPLTLDQLDQAADHIHETVSLGKRIYVHCRAGHGRSAMAVAGYLIKHMGKKAQEAIDIILRSRPTSTVWLRLKQLTEFENFVSNGV